MDHSQERRFVESFIVKNRRERLLNMLTTPKKRHEGLSRFCHRAKDLLDPDRIIMEGEDLERRPEFMSFAKAHGEMCLVLSPDPFVDGQLLPFEDAVIQAVMSFDAVIIIGKDFAAVFGEVMKGGRGKYLLSEYK